MFVITKAPMPEEMRKHWLLVSQKLHAASDKGSDLYWCTQNFWRMLITVSPWFVFLAVLVVWYGRKPPFGFLSIAILFLCTFGVFILLVRFRRSETYLRHRAKNFDKDLKANEVLKYEFRFPAEHWFLEHAAGITCFARVDENNTAYFFDNKQIRIGFSIQIPKSDTAQSPYIDDKNFYRICDLASLCKNEKLLLENWIWYKGQYTECMGFR